jgi:CheY-like chemotaxis protein
VFVDPVQVEQVLMNLVINARDAMPDGGRLSVETRACRFDEGFARRHAWARAGEFVELRVTDTGVGIAEETLQKIFDPFFTTKEPGKGTGLGLAMVYGIVSQHDGLINVESAPGRGATFRVLFPAMEGAADPLPPRAPAAARAGHETILLAEDDEMVRELVVRTLEGHGYRVLTAADGEAALRIFEAHAGEIAIAIVDAIMPRLGGREVYQALRRRRPTLPFLLVSGYSMNVIDERFVREEGLAFVQKPFSPADLARRVRELLDRGAR